jgi:hypothetical protein
MDDRLLQSFEWAVGKKISLYRKFTDRFIDVQKMSNPSSVELGKSSSSLSPVNNFLIKISVFLGSFQEKLSRFAKTLENVLEIETFFMKNKDNYDYVEWFVGLPDQDIKKTFAGVWQTTTTQSVPDEAQRSLADLLDHYMSFVTDCVSPIEPNKKYYFDIRRIGQFSLEDQVPRFIRSEGNFASAVCLFFTPIEPRSHDGSCAVESILLAVKGKDAYPKSDSTSKGRLERDIREFREKIVQYARDHEAQLISKFGENDVRKLIQKYSNEHQNQWTSDMTLYCAAQVYERHIEVYTQFEGGVFLTNSEGRLAPVMRFLYEEVDVKEGTKHIPTISVIFWGNAHYALLENKSDSKPS